MTLKLDGNGCCKIHSAKRGEASVSDGDKEIVTNERYVVMPWKVVTMNDKNVTLAEAVDSMFSRRDLRLRSKKEEKKREKKLRRSVQNITKRI